MHSTSHIKPSNSKYDSTSSIDISIIFEKNWAWGFGTGTFNFYLWVCMKVFTSFVVVFVYKFYSKKARNTYYSSGYLQIQFMKFSITGIQLHWSFVLFCHKMWLLAVFTTGFCLIFYYDLCINKNITFINHTSFLSTYTEGASRLGQTTSLYQSGQKTSCPSTTWRAWRRPSVAMWRRQIAGHRPLLMRLRHPMPWY